MWRSVLKDTFVYKLEECSAKKNDPMYVSVVLSVFCSVFANALINNPICPAPSTNDYAQPKCVAGRICDYSTYLIYPPSCTQGTLWRFTSQDSTFCTFDDPPTQLRFYQQGDCTNCPEGKTSSIRIMPTEVIATGSWFQEHAITTALVATDACYNCSAGYYSRVGRDCAKCPDFSSSVAGSSQYSQCVCISTYFGPAAWGECQACPENSQVRTNKSSTTKIADCVCNAGHALNASLLNYETGVAWVSGVSIGKAKSGMVSYTVGSANDWEMWDITSPSQVGSVSVVFTRFNTTQTMKLYHTDSTAAGSVASAEISSATFDPNSVYTSSTGYMRLMLDMYTGGFPGTGSPTVGVDFLWRVQTYCTPCAPSTYSIGLGSTQCVLCDLGKYATGGNSWGFGHTMCEICPAGKYKSVQSDSSCTNCTVHSVSRAGSVSKDACECAMGRAIFEGETDCQMCPRGKIGDILNMCEFCAVGMYWQTDYTCKPCGMHGTRYKAQLLLERTARFPAISPVDIAAVEAFQIPNSKYDLNLCAGCECSVFRDSLPSSTLDDCSTTGHNLRLYLDATTRQCETCPNHKIIVRDASQRSCMGYDVARTNTEFRKWNDELQIYQCIAGYSSTDAATSWTWTSHHSCQACEIGKYKPYQSVDLCTECPRHTRTISTAAISVQECMYCSTNHLVTYEVSNRSSLSMFAQYIFKYVAQRRVKLSLLHAHATLSPGRGGEIVRGKGCRNFKQKNILFPAHCYLFFCHTLY